MMWHAARFLAVTAVLGACASGGDAAPETTTPKPAPAPRAAEPGLAALDIEMEDGNDGVAALVRASLQAGCKVQQKEQDGNPSLISECPDGLFGAVQVGNTLSIRCVDMAIGDCEIFVLSILDAAKKGDSGSEPEAAPPDDAGAPER